MRHLLASVLSIAVLLSIGGCSAPRFAEDLQKPNPWFSVESVEIDKGLVTTQGSFAESVPATLAVNPGVPQHFVVGLYPNPSATGGDVAVEPDTTGQFTVTYDFGEPRAGIYVLEFSKSEWGQQYIYVNLAEKEWAESDIW